MQVVCIISIMVIVGITLDRRAAIIHITVGIFGRIVDITVDIAVPSSDDEIDIGTTPAPGAQVAGTAG